MRTRTIAYYCAGVGALMGLQWLFFLVTGNVPELETEPLAIAFHLAAELATAGALILARSGLLRRAGRAGAEWRRSTGLIAARTDGGLHGALQAVQRQSLVQALALGAQLRGDVPAGGGGVRVTMPPP